MTGQVLDLRESVCCRVRQARIVGPFLYKGDLRQHVGFGREPAWISEPRETIDGEATLVTSFSGSRWFGCLLLDDLTFEVIPGVAEPLLRMQSSTYPQESGYRELLSLEESRLVTNALVEDLSVVSEPALNPSRSDRYRQLRERLRQSVAARRPPRGVYLRRSGPGEARVLLNEPKVEEALSSRDFDIIDPVESTPLEIAERTLEASIVAGVEGSQLSHGIFSMADDAAFMVIQPPHRFALPYKDFADCLGMEFAFLVADPHPSGGFEVDIDDLHRTLDLLR